MVLGATVQFAQPLRTYGSAVYDTALGMVVNNVQIMTACWAIVEQCYYRLCRY